MERLAGKLPFALLLTVALLSVAGAMGAVPARAAIDLGPCRGSNALACGHLSVPLSPAGAAPGALTLAIRRRRAPVGEARTAVVALAGGPGQAAIPFTESFAEVLGPILSTRDLIVFDQRGTGLSGALRCPELRARTDSPTRTVMRCAEQIGPRRGFYTTPETVADIEAIRVAGGYEKLVLYGTSYGTKVALQYAQQHPDHVEALVLDSVVEPNGPEPLHLSTFAAVPRVLRELCAFDGCAQITRHPVADVRRLVSRMRVQRLTGTAIDGHGRPHTVHVSSAQLLGILVEGDLDPLLRAEYPAAVHSAAAGDMALLARLLAHATAGGEEEAPERAGDPLFDVPLYLATVCEEERFPWSRSASPSTRLAEASAKIRSLPASAFAPFTRSDALPFSDMVECAAWPFTRPQPPLSGGPLPSVPTLIVSGSEDLRTPTSGARAVASTIPGSHLLVVPDTGHSVLTSEPEACGIAALHALFSHRAIRRCPAKAPPRYLRPTPLAPRRLAEIAPARGYAGRAGRTLAAIGLTFADLSRQFALAILLAGNPEAAGGLGSVRTGGLRGGWAAFSQRRPRLTLHDYAYVPGVEISGWIGFERGQLRIAGRASAAGVLRLTANRHYVGELAGVRVDVGSKRLSAQAARRRSTPALPSRVTKQGAARTLLQAGTLAQRLQGAVGSNALAAVEYALAHAHAFRHPNFPDALR